ncbi:hypothetical protein CHS0354_020345 [Potamilus streckersoni]|uniref:Uncharacterized protein n=1 Tax=Potamilus streckersoni TaxID=2493646 RepID=A0AAE0SFZ4_9BIVA|nr:hypothetical protein CHS0354_020345 [Potamilus streckersoni]
MKNRKYHFLLPSSLVFICFILYCVNDSVKIHNHLYFIHQSELRSDKYLINNSLKSFTLRYGSTWENDIPLLTLFTSWIDRPDKHVVQNRTIENWMTFWPLVHPVIFTNDSTLAKQCLKRGWSVLPLRRTGAGGVPVVKYMYLDAMKYVNSTFYAFSNSDILFNDGLIKTLLTVKRLGQVYNNFIAVGRRTNIDYKLAYNASDWRNLSIVSRKGRLSGPKSSDYFITTKGYPWRDMEEIVIGRPRVDIWIIQSSRLKGIIVINATPTILALHQTTETGNSEGSSKPNSFYNVLLLQKLRNLTISYELGQPGCGEFVTESTIAGDVHLVRQDISKECKLL